MEETKRAGRTFILLDAQIGDVEFVPAEHSFRLTANPCLQPVLLRLQT